LQAHERTATANTPASLAAELAKNRRVSLFELAVES